MTSIRANGTNQADWPTGIYISAGKSAAVLPRGNAERIPSGEYTRLVMVVAVMVAVMVAVAATDGITSVNWAKSRLASITETGTHPLLFSSLLFSPPLSGETETRL